MAADGSISNEQPFGRLTLITPSDSTVYDPPLVGLLVNGAGNVSVVDNTGATVVIPSVVAGALLRIKVSKVNSTGTTATNMVGLRL